jgi:hypothetical protein
MLLTNIRLGWKGLPRINIKGASILGRLLALLTNIRLGWKGLPGTTNLAYWAHVQVSMKIKYGDYDSLGQCYKKIYGRNLLFFKIS